MGRRRPDRTSTSGPVASEPPIELTAEDVRAIDRALDSVRAGKGASLVRFRALLARL